jgi:multiple sugar transport system substrate-binding protein
MLRCSRRERKEVSGKHSIADGAAPFGESALSRRDFLKLGGAGLAGATLLGTAGCGGWGGRSDDLVFASWPDVGTTHGVTQQLLKQFNKQGKGRATFREGPLQETGEYLEKLKTEFQVGGGRIDVTVADTIWTAELAEGGWIADVSNRFSGGERSRFLDGSVQSLAYRGGIYGVPWGTDAGMLYYRKDLLEKSGFSGPPKTWEELEEMAGKAVRDSGTRFGFVFQGADYEGGVCNGLEFIWTHGGEVVDPEAPGRVIVGSPESVAGLATERSMVSNRIAPQAVANYGEMEAQTTFLAGDAVFCRNWPYMYGLAANPETYAGRLGVKPEQVGVSALPVGNGQRQSASCLGGQNLLINASSDKQDEIWDLVRFLADEKRQKRRVPDNAPTLKSLYEDRRVLEAMPVLSLGKEALENARPRPVSPRYRDMSSAMSRQFNSVLTGATAPEVAVETLQSELQQIIERGE